MAQKCVVASAVDAPMAVHENVVSWVDNEVEHYFWCGTILEYPPTAQALSAHVSTTVNVNHHVLIGYLDDILVGFGEVDVDDGVAVLRRIIVASDRRSEGVGMLLVLALIDEAVSLGVSRVELDVSEPNVGAVRCYTKCGFRVVDVVNADDRPWRKFRMVVDV